MQFLIPFYSRRCRAGPKAVAVHLSDRFVLLFGSGARISAADPDHFPGHRSLAVDDQELCDISVGAPRLRDRHLRKSVESGARAVSVKPDIW